VALAHLIEENRLLRRQLGNRRMHLADEDRRRLARRAYRVGRAVVKEIATIATPDTPLRLHRHLNARKGTYARRAERRSVLLENCGELGLAHWTLGTSSFNKTIEGSMRLFYNWNYKCKRD
jgi:hypothetical protein